MRQFKDRHPRRRDVLGTGLLLVVSQSGLAQGASPRKIAILAARPRSDADMQAFLGELRGLGYPEGDRLAIDYVQADPSQFLTQAQEIVRRAPDLIYAPTTAAAAAAKAATSTIPIVFATAHEPAEIGLVHSLAKPGGNVTGMSSFNADLTAKRVELFLELVPKLDRVGVLRRPLNRENRSGWDALSGAARTRGVSIAGLDVSTPSDIETAFREALAKRVQGVLLLDDVFISTQWRQIAAVASAARLPTSSTWGAAVDVGILFSYGPNLVANHQRAAGYVARILNGSHPSDLPVEQPMRFELVLNQHTAEAVGVRISQSLLVRADRLVV